MKNMRRVPYLCNDVTILCVDLSYGTDIPDHAQHFIDLRKRRVSSEARTQIFQLKGNPLGEGEIAARLLW